MKRDLGLPNSGFPGTVILLPSRHTTATDDAFFSFVGSPSVRLARMAAPVIDSPSHAEDSEVTLVNASSATHEGEIDEESEVPCQSEIPYSPPARSHAAASRELISSPLLAFQSNRLREYADAHLGTLGAKVQADRPKPSADKTTSSAVELVAAGIVSQAAGIVKLERDARTVKTKDASLAGAVCNTAYSLLRLAGTTLLRLFKLASYSERVGLAVGLAFIFRTQLRCVAKLS